MNTISIFAGLSGLYPLPIRNKAPAMSERFKVFIFNELRCRDDDVPSG